MSPGCLPNKLAQSDLCSKITCRQTQRGTFCAESQTSALKRSSSPSAKTLFMNHKLWWYDIFRRASIHRTGSGDSVQRTLDAIGVLIISTAAGGGVLGLKTWYLVFQVQVHLSYASVYLDLDSGYLSGVGQVHLPPLWHLYQNVCLNRLSIASGHPQIEPS